MHVLRSYYKRVYVDEILKIYFVFSEEQGQPPAITPAGFQFLLMDTSSQIWYFMLKYLETIEVHEQLVWMQWNRIG